MPAGRSVPQLTPSSGRKGGGGSYWTGEWGGDVCNAGRLLICCVVLTMEMMTRLASSSHQSTELCRLGGEEAVLDTKRPLLATGGRGLRLGQAGQPIWRMVMVRGGCHQPRPPPLSSPGGTLQGTHKYLPHWVKYHKIFHCNDEMTSKLPTHTDYAAHSD